MVMPRDMIFLPVVIQVVLTLGMYIALSVAKGRAAKRGEVDEARRALFEDAWPEGVRKINNNIRNQFEVPVLFYVLALVLWILDDVGPRAQILAWLFVLSRLAHAYVHTGVNHVPTRRRIFSFGVLIVLLLSIEAAVSILAR